MYIYSRAKHRRSGTTMQKLRPRGEHLRYQATREVLPGYPKEAFKSLDEVLAYATGDRIACLICGKLYKSVLIHVAKIHDMDDGQYRLRFNIPSRISLNSEETIAKQKAHCSKLRAEGKLFPLGSARARSARKENRRRPCALSRAVIAQALRERAARGPENSRWVDDDYSWHLQQVSQHYSYQQIEPPPGRLSWSGYKKRRKADPALAAKHRDARERRPRFDIVRWRGAQKER